MIDRLRMMLSWLTVLALVLTGHAMAVARGMPGAAGYAEYCINDMAVMVAVDADGNPTGESHICPDVSLSLLNMVSPEGPVVLAPAQQMRKATATDPAFVEVIRLIKAMARAPPVRT
jgi:hypothetical protein